MSANENQIPIYVLQPEISGQIKQTNLEEIKNWINAGELLPHHQVRIKNLSWVEAHKIPVFQSLFESKKNEQTDQSNSFHSQPLPAAAQKIEPGNKKAERETTLATAETADKDASKTIEPSAVFKAYEKKVLAKSKPNERKTGSAKRKTKPARPLPQSPKKSSAVKQAIGFAAGCVLAFLLSFGGSYLWVYQLKAPVEIDEKSIPGLANLDNQLTADKLDLRFKKAEQEQKLKDAGQTENASPQTDFSRQIAQLEKQYDTQRKTVIENHRNKLKDSDFTATFSFSSVVLLALFLMGRIFYGKTSKPVEYRTPSKPPAKRSPRISDIEDEISESLESEESSEETGEPSVKVRPAKSQDKADDHGEILDTDENAESEESQTNGRCLLHPEKSSAFICEDCDNHYCDECLKTFGEMENCCPFCKVVCKSPEANKDKNKKENKPVNLLDINKENSDFVIYEYEEERSKTAGVIQAFVVALLISAAVSILWTYKIHPYLENRNKETAQNISPDEAGNNGQIPLDADPATSNKEIDDALKTGPCIDPETKQPFDCDEETRRALYEHTRKTQSVEKAKKDVLNTAELVSGSKNENKEPDDPQIVAAKAGQNKKETSQLILSFGISFVLIFGLLLATVFFGKDKKTFLNQNKEEEAGEDYEENSEEEIFEEEPEETAEEETV